MGERVCTWACLTVRVSSAGPGHGGAYLVPDGVLQQMQAHGAVDAGAFLEHVRTHLLNTEVRGHDRAHWPDRRGWSPGGGPAPTRYPPQEQFVFDRDALAETDECGETAVAAEQLHRYVDQLLALDQGGGTRLERQFKVGERHGGAAPRRRWGADAAPPSPQQLLCRSAACRRSAALLPCNRSKNRVGALMPGKSGPPAPRC